MNMKKRRPTSTNFADLKREDVERGKDNAEAEASQDGVHLLLHLNNANCVKSKLSKHTATYYVLIYLGFHVPDVSSFLCSTCEHPIVHLQMDSSGGWSPISHHADLGSIGFSSSTFCFPRRLSFHLSSGAGITGPTEAAVPRDSVPPHS